MTKYLLVILAVMLLPLCSGCTEGRAAASNDGARADLLFGRAF